MYGRQSEAFDTVSEQALRQVLRCCASSDDSTALCASFRSEFATFMEEYQPYKKCFGSCGIGRQEG
ncbi:hypothetical protein SAMN05216562_0706 [Microbulbifer marinus]|uniref:Uncharacterized protein n=2 Tax=Microbulbifer marinus TaxID=658218 RepID=A0A1H3WD59_9GAMM|nr:hypothetical protein SAMN05216562_0706 [Microbulbifer marinus]